MLVTDPMPASPRERVEHARSDGLRLPALPARETVLPLYAALEQAMAAGRAPPVRKASSALLLELAVFYGAAVPALRVLGARPLDSRERLELFGDYDLRTHAIRVWMRTAIREDVTSLGTFVSTLVHELCHHLDVTVFELPSTPHTRGFYQRVDDLYHLVRGTAPERRRVLRWVPAGSRWRIDWARSKPAAPDRA